ncbi:DUF2617 family protein [Streptomyces sp. ST2-7A]|uniref:DUF2617 family protein n=1 Tax=Streptomyces sp. ST2-7A TaxID=2907214 RepID=UPI0027E2E32B|nr:DUF2617 family protein [Streptomyces sp. ST2-7A]
MLRSINAPYADTRPADLAWSLDRPPLPALASRSLRWGDDEAPRLELRVLGASHQVLLHHPTGRLVETVACAPDRTTPLPAAVARRDGAVDYAFSSRVEHLPPVDLAARAEEVTELTADHPHGLIGVFPGRPHSLTALLAHRRPDGVDWETWHTYPDAGAVVVTRGRVATGRRDTVPTGLPIPAARRTPENPRVGTGRPTPSRVGGSPRSDGRTRPPAGGYGE